MSEADGPPPHLPPAQVQGQEHDLGGAPQGQIIEEQMQNLNLNAEEDGAAEEEEGVMVVPVVDVAAAAAALQEEIVVLHQDIVPVPPALLEPINNQVY